MYAPNWSHAMPCQHCRPCTCRVVQRTFFRFRAPTGRKPHRSAAGRSGHRLVAAPNPPRSRTKCLRCRKIRGKYGKIWENMGKYGKIWENQGKIWENPSRFMSFISSNMIQPIQIIQNVAICCYSWELNWIFGVSGDKYDS